MLAVVVDRARVPRSRRNSSQNKWRGNYGLFLDS
jgi:hypothetical protein